VKVVANEGMNHFEDIQDSPHNMRLNFIKKKRLLLSAHVASSNEK